MVVATGGLICLSEGREQTGHQGMDEEKEGGIDPGQADSQGEESSISRLAEVAMVTELGRDVIMLWLIQTWQAPITPPLEREKKIEGRWGEGKMQGSKCGGGGGGGQGKV